MLEEKSVARVVGSSRLVNSAAMQWTWISAQSGLVAFNPGAGQKSRLAAAAAIRCFIKRYSEDACMRVSLSSMRAVYEGY